MTSLNQKYFNASNALMHILTFKDVPCDVQRHFSQLIKTAFHTHTPNIVHEKNVLSDQGLTHPQMEILRIMSVFSCPVRVETHENIKY